MLHIAYAFAFFIRAQQFSGIATYKTSWGVSINMGDKVAEAEQERISRNEPKNYRRNILCTLALLNPAGSRLSDLMEGLHNPPTSAGGMDIIFASGGKDELLYKNMASGLYEKEKN